MAFAEELENLKADLSAAGVPVAEVLDRAGVHRITWGRWNGGYRTGSNPPRVTTWFAVKDAAAALIAERHGSAERGAA